jgi:DNA-binding PadR family transcriptional regulator
MWHDYETQEPTQGEGRSRRGRCAPEGCGPREAHFRHGFGGHGFGAGGHGHGPWGRRQRGDVRAAVLAILTEKPMHGYEIMQQLEERTGGFWRPSPGSIYPTLQLLEDQGLVKGEELEGKRVFALTDEGKAEAAASAERMGGAPWEGAETGGSRYKLRQSFAQLFAAAKQVGQTGSQEQVDKTLEILAEARKRIYALLADAE